MALNYGGTNIFGVAVRCVHVMDPPAEQLATFFGQSGKQSLWGGVRGRVFMIEGVWFGESLAALNNAEDVYHTFIDGIARDFEDTRGRVWPQVLVKPAQPTGKVLQDFRGLYLPYKSMLVGLI